MTINELKQAIANEKPRSAWGRGVKGYAEGLAEELEEAIQGGYFAEEKLTDREQREMVRNAVRERKAEQDYETWLKELRGKAFVEYREPPQ